MWRKYSLFLILLLFCSFSAERDPGKEYHDDSLRVQQPALITFGTIADLQYCDCEPSGNRFYRNSLAKAREAVATFENERVDFVINLGDLIDKDIRSYEAPMEIFNNSSLTYYHCAGNHDLFPTRREQNRVPHLSMSNPYFSFSQKGFRFIILDATDVSSFSWSAKRRKEAYILIEGLKSQGKEYGESYNGALGEEQMNWLKKELEESVAASENVLIFCHNPVWPEGRHNLLNSEDILNMMAGFDNIIAWFNGHNHSGSYGNRHLIHFVGLKGMVETETVYSYSVIEIYSNKIWIKGYGSEKSQILAY